MHMWRPLLALNLIQQTHETAAVQLLHAKPAHGGMRGSTMLPAAATERRLARSTTVLHCQRSCTAMEHS